MKTFFPSFALVACWLLFAPSVVGQELAAFHIPDAAQSSRSFLFNCTPFTGSGSTNASRSGVEGMMTILAKRFTTTNQPGVVTITFHDCLICRADRSKGEGLGSPMGSPVVIFREFSVSYLSATPILVHGHFVRLADFNEKAFNLPTPHHDTYTGEEAIKKLKEMGLEPPEDMDWEKATNK